MKLTPIDRSTWKREEYFKHYYSDVPCTYSMTVPLDITNLLKNNYKLYPAMLYCLAKVVNRHEEFRTAMGQNGQPGIYSQMLPCYTVFHRESETFSNLWTEYSDDYHRFCQSYAQDMELYGAIERMDAKPNTPENVFPVSMLPWASFEGFNLNLQKGYDYLLPIFTMGKFTCQEERYTLPLAIQVHHAVCDGFHVCRFINEVQELLNEQFNKQEL